MKLAFLRQLLPGKTLRPAWIYHSPLPIWHFEFSGTGRIVVESRDTQARQAAYSFVNESTGARLVGSIPVHDSWWSGIELFRGDLLLVHGFAQPDLPEHRGIYAHAAADGALLWKQPDHTYWFSDEKRIYSIRTMFEKRIGAAIDIESGEIVEQFPEIESMYELRKQSPDQSTDLEVLFAAPADSGTIPPVTARLLERLAGRLPIAGIPEFLSTHGKLIASAYLRSPKEPSTLQCRLWIADETSGSILYTDMLLSRANAPVPDSFFVRNGRLYYVKEQTDLTAIELWKS